MKPPSSCSATALNYLFAQLLNKAPLLWQFRGRKRTATKHTFTLQSFFFVICCCCLFLIISQKWQQSQKLFRIFIFSALWFQFNFHIVPFLRVFLPVAFFVLSQLVTVWLLCLFMFTAWVSSRLLSHTHTHFINLLWILQNSSIATLQSSPPDLNDQTDQYICFWGWLWFHCTCRVLCRHIVSLSA